MAAASSLLASACSWRQPSWLHRSILLLVLYTSTVSCYKPFIPYGKHCSSIIPDSKPSALPSPTIPFAPNQLGFFQGGDEILNRDRHLYSSNRRKVLLLQTHNVYATDADDVYKVDASLIIETTDMGFYVEDFAYSYSHSTQVIVDGSWIGPLSFEVEGYWSKSTGKVCMVGSSSSRSVEGNTRVLSAVLKLNHVWNSSNITSLVSGTLESLSKGPSDFHPISLLMIPQMNYKYSKVSEELDSISSAPSLSLPFSVPMCSIFRGRAVRSFKLEYARGCNLTRSCTPLGEAVGDSHQLLSWRLVHCSDDIRSLRILLEFHNASYVDYYRPFSPTSTLVAEGSWDAKRNQLRGVACRILNASDSFRNSRVDDCSIRLSLRFPAVWSIRNTSSIVGQFWSSKPVNDPAYFDRIMFRNHEHVELGIPGLKYNYTLVQEARASCQEKKPGRVRGIQYPDPNSPDMKFDLSVKNSKGKRIGWGNSQPIFVGDKIAVHSTSWVSTSSTPSRSSFWKQSSSSSSTPAMPVIGASPDSPVNISYQMSFTLTNSSFQVSAEGIYDDKTGRLCMVGCKYLSDSSNQAAQNDSEDCNILVRLQFPPLDSNFHINGSIESRRENSDPLFFELLSFTAVSYYKLHSRASIERMDREIIMVLISYTLLCVFAVCQILHVKRHPKVFPFVSLLMLLMLTLGQMVPLLLNFEALFLLNQNQNRRTFLRRSGGWLEVNEVIVRAVIMAAFLLLCRLLLLVWSARSADRNQQASWIAEKRTLFVSLPLYTAGCLIALSLNWKNGKLGDGMHSLWADLRCYAGLVLDGFLFPQILLNIFQNSRENALSCFFYMGITFVRLLPHAYDLYRAHYYADDFDWSYRYADPGTDYYSTFWDVSIPLGGLLLAAIIYLQQQFGARCLLPERCRELQGYEKVQVPQDA